MQRANMGAFDDDIIQVLSQLAPSDDGTDWQWDTVRGHPKKVDPLTVEEFKRNIPREVQPTLDELQLKQILEMMETQ